MSEFEFEKDKAVRVGVIFPDVAGRELSLNPASRMEEACGLAIAINLEVAYREIIKIKNPKSGSLIGEGNIKKLLSAVNSNGLELLIFDTSLTPVQQRNLERALQVKVIDRTALILEIFGQRAQTKEGKLQVELAHLTYQRSRLVRSWTHLERQRGGGGFLGGPGETQIELDRRLIDNRILHIKKELEQVKKTRTIQRQARARVPYPIVAFIGYTNAGKSSLFNLLSSSSVLAKDMLFATLDTAMRKIKLPSRREVIISDTVGFISDLPHELVMAFRATLEEVTEADIIVHVRDIASDNTISQKQDVLDVLKSLGLEKEITSPYYIEALNKVDLLSSDKKNKLLSHIKPGQVAVSALTGEGIDIFLQLLDARLSLSYQRISFNFSASQGALYAWIKSNTQILSENHQNNLITMQVQAPAEIIARLQNKLKEIKSKENKKDII